MLTKSYAAYHLAAEAARALQGKDGWTVLRNDKPRRCSFGFAAYRQHNEVEEVEEHHWRPLGEEPHIHIYSAKNVGEFLDLVKRFFGECRPFRCDDPEKRLIGLAAFNAVEKTVTIIEMPLTQVKDSGNEQFALDIRIQIAIDAFF